MFKVSIACYTCNY